MMHWRYCSSAKSDSFIKWSPTRMSSSVLAFFFNTSGWFSRLANAHSIKYQFISSNSAKNPIGQCENCLMLEL
jgi:hypothetical protein